MSGSGNRNDTGREHRLVRFLVEEVRDGILTLYRDGRISYGNARFAQTVKSTPEKLTGSRFQRLLSSEEVPRFEAWLSSGKPAKREFTLIASDGSRIPAEIVVRSLGENNDELAMLVNDISRRRRNEEVLANIVGNAPNLAITAWDSSATFTIAAGKAFEALGIDPQQMVGKSIYLSQTDNSAVVERRRRVMSGDFVSVREEVRGRTLDMWYAPLKDAQGSVIGGVSAAADITELIRAQSELQQRVQREEAIAAFGQRALRGSPRDILIREATLLAARTLGVEGAGMGELQPDGTVAIKGMLGLPGENRRMAAPAHTYPQINQTLQTQRPTIIEDYAADPVFHDLDLVAKHGIASGLVVPVSGKDGAYGTLGVHSLSPRKFSAYDINFVQALANILAQAIDRERTEDELRRIGEYYRSLIQNVSDIVGVVGSDGSILFVSDSVTRVLGRKPEEAIGANVLLFHHPADTPRVRESFAAAFKHPDEPVVVESRVRHEDGRWVDFELTFKSTTSVSGRPVLVCAMHDISERKRLEQEHRLLASIIEASDDAIGSSNRDGFITSWNRGAERLFGYRASEVLGKRRAEFDPHFTGEIAANFRALMREGRPIRYETRRTRRDGSIVEVSVTLSPLRDANGETAGLTSITRDITERRLAERARELARSNAELEQFAYVASHDLKEPLHVIAGFANLLKQRLAGGPDAEALEFIGYVENGAQRMRDLVDALLDYATVNPKLEDLGPVDCTDVVNHAIHDLGALIKSTNAEVICAQLPTVTGDERLLAHVFQNLIGNSLKFRGTRPPIVEIGARRENIEWLFWVRDNGIGIAQRDAERIFNMFERVHHRSEYPGRGIGLAICKRTIDRLGGHIWLDSTPGKGTTFYFTLPALDVSQCAGRP